jgi:hypothetical protein
VVRHLEKIRRDFCVLCNEALLDFLLNVSCQQESHAAVFEPKYKRIVIRRFVDGSQVGRPQHIASNPVPIEFVSAYFVHDANAALTRFL